MNEDKILILKEKRKLIAAQKEKIRMKLKYFDSDVNLINSILDKNVNANSFVEDFSPEFIFDNSVINSQNNNFKISDYKGANYAYIPMQKAKDILEVFLKENFIKKGTIKFLDKKYLGYLHVINITASELINLSQKLFSFIFYPCNLTCAIRLEFEVDNNIVDEFDYSVIIQEKIK